MEYRETIQPGELVIGTVWTVSKPSPHPSKFFAAAMSVLVPGIGQIYTGQVVRGLVWLTFIVAFDVLTHWAGRYGAGAFLALFVAEIILVACAAVDAARCANGLIVFARRQWWRTWHGALILAALLLVADAAMPNISALDTGRTLRLSAASMIPAILPGDRVVAVRPAGFAPRRGDVVAMQRPDERSLRVKRIVGLPGDRVRVEHGRLAINGVWVPRAPTGEAVPDENGRSEFAVMWERLGDRRYRVAIDGPGLTAAPPPTEIVVPPDSYFVIGDNRSYGDQSRFFGCVKRNQIRYRVDAVAWPPSRIQFDLADER